MKTEFSKASRDEQERLTTSEGFSVILPTRLTRKLDAFTRHLCIAETLLTVSGAVSGLFLSYLLLFIMERFWPAPQWLRFALLLLGAVSAAGFALYWSHHWIWRRRPIEKIARMIRKREPRFGDRLLGAVELSRHNDPAYGASPQLCAAAIRQIADESEKHDLANAVSQKKPRIFFVSFLLLAGLISIPVAMLPRAGWNTVHRWVRPFASIPRYTFVNVHDLPNELVVPRGEEFKLQCRLDKHSRWRPSAAVARMGNQPALKTRETDGSYEFTIPGQTEENTFLLKIGDFRQSIPVRPRQRPELAGLRCEISLPAYLQHSPREFVVKTPNVDVLEQSRVRFTGEASRELFSARLETGGSRQRLPVQGSSFQTPFTQPTNSTEYVFTWKDRFRLSGKKPREVEVKTVEDMPPFVECRNLPQAVAILENEAIVFNVAADDDYGLKQVWLNWWWNKGGEDDDSLNSKTVWEGGSEAKEVVQKFTFSPVTMQIPEDTSVRLCAYSTDYLPGRKPSASSIHRIFILSSAQHEKLLRQSLDDIQAKIEELARAEEELINRNQGLKPDKAGDMDPETLEEELRKSEDSERKGASSLEELRAEIQELMKEAMRNNNISSESIRKWSEQMREMQKLAGNEMQQAANKLGRAADSPSEQQESLEEAIDLEKEILEKLRKMSSSMNQSIEDMIAASFVNRLLSIASKEGDIRSSLETLIPEIVGLSPEELPDKSKKSVAVLAGKQGDTARKAGYIQDDLIGYYARTQQEPFHVVYKEMKEAQAVKGLKSVRKSIEQNRGSISMKELKAWQDRFLTWADYLRKNCSACEGSGQEQGQETELSETDIQIIIDLMRARQREEDLREQTRLVDSEKDSNENYTAAAIKLSRIQEDIADDMRPLERIAQNRKLRNLIDKVVGEMVNARMYLARPQTGATTIAIETEIIELLSNSIKQASGNCSQAQMAALQMMLGMSSSAGASGGGSNAGGASNAANIEGTATTAEIEPESRDVDKASGRNPDEFPREYRDLLEAYFRAVEEQEAKR